MKSLQVHFAIGWALVLVTLYLVGYYVPGSGEGIGSSYLIFFFHFPSAMNCLNLFIFAGVLSALYLVSGEPRWEQLAATATEVGVLACTITMVTGSIWAKAAWGVWWNMRDPRLLSVSIMWLVYLAYMSLRGTIEEPEKRARFSSVYGVIACITVPFVYYAIKWFGVISHPLDIDLADRAMVGTRWFGAFAFFVLYTAFWHLRYRATQRRYAIARLQEGFADAGM